MATENQGTIDPVLSKLFSRVMTRAFQTRTEAMRYLRAVPNDSGKTPSWVVKFGGTKKAKNFADGADVGASEFDTRPKKDAALGWGNYRDPALVTDLAVVTAGNAGEGNVDELVNLVESTVTDSITSLALTINEDVFTGTGAGVGGPNIIGLLGGAADPTGTYAGINRATFPQWAGHVLGNGGVSRPLTEDLLRQGDQLVFEAGQPAPNLILTTGGVHRKYAGLFAPEMRVNTGGEAPQLLQKGTMDLYWGTAPLVRDVHCPAGKLIMLNTDSVELVYPRELANLIGMPRPTAEERMLRTDQQQLVIPVVVEKMPRSGNALKLNVWTFVQLRVRSPNGVCVIEDISE